jgi:hypothetical protein
VTEAPRRIHDLTRRGLLKAGGGLVLIAGTSGLAACSTRPGNASGPGAGTSSASQSDGQVLQFRSRPDLHPVAVEVATDRAGTAPGLIVLGTYYNQQGQQGPMIVDTSGELAWFRSLSRPT